jgi:hypothetical protein
MFSIAIAMFFLITVVVPVHNAELYEKPTNETENNGLTERTFTHTVFAEEASATWCQYCPTVVTILDNIYQGGQYDFYYVTLVDDMNPTASARIGELSVTGFPTVVYDGGYTRLIGAGHSQQDHENVIQQCGNRTVANIDLDLSAYWLGNGEIQVTIDVTNNEASTYDGHLHVYVTEIYSRWNVLGTQYKFAMINDYAINQNVQINSGSTETFDELWSGYTDITLSNIKVIASIFDASTKWTDETDAADPEIPNTSPPTTPMTPSGPTSGIVGMSYDYQTVSTEPNGDEIKYGWDWNGDDDVDEWTGYYPSGSMVTTEHAWSSTGTYQVKVKAKDQFGTESSFSSPLSVTITIGDPPSIPSAPIGETNGMHGTSYEYATSTTDPNMGDQVYYYFDWGDGSNSGWIGPNPSGQVITDTKIWDEPGTFDVKVKAKDLAGSETDWSPVTAVTMRNTPPETPRRPNGPMDGSIGIHYQYSTVTTDAEDDSIAYLFDWGDGTDSGWGHSSSSHSWSLPGTYEVRVKAKDWDQSEWSPSLPVTIEGLAITVDAGGPYAGVIGEDILFEGNIPDGTPPFSWNWDFGDGNTSELENPTHAYAQEGTYTITLTATDSNGGGGIGYSSAEIIVTNPPYNPVIDGPMEGEIGETYTYTFSADDPDGDDVYLWIEWFADDPNASWIGPYDSGEEVDLDHIYTEEGEFSIRAKSKDTHDFESEGWTTLEVTMPKEKGPIPFISWILQRLVDLFPWITEFIIL